MVPRGNGRVSALAAKQRVELACLRSLSGRTVGHITASLWACSRRRPETGHEPASAPAFESRFRLQSCWRRPSQTFVRRVGRGIRTEWEASPPERRGARPREAPPVHSGAALKTHGGLARAAGTSGMVRHATAPARSRSHRRIGRCASWGCSSRALTMTSELDRKQGECHVSGGLPTEVLAASPPQPKPGVGG